MKNNFLQSARKQFDYYKSLGEKAFDRLDEDHFFWQANENSNSIAVIVNHLHGNMLSRWTDFLITDGEKPWRNRDHEFEDELKTRKEVIQKWEQGWNCLFDALNSINDNNFTQTIYIRNEPHSIVDAVNRQLAHYAYHIGQIVYMPNCFKIKIGKVLVFLKKNRKNTTVKNLEKESLMKTLQKGHINTL